MGILHMRPTVLEVRHCARSPQASGYLAESPGGRPAGPRAAALFQDPVEILIIRPPIIDVRNRAPSPRASGVSLNPTRPGVGPWVAPLPRCAGRLSGPGVAGIFRRFLQTTRVRSLILEVRNRTASPRLSGYFAAPQTAGRGGESRGRKI